MTERKRALSVREVLTRRREVFPFEGRWAEAFGQPESTGVWFVWGSSGNGKSSFVMQLCRELCRWTTVAYDSLEEGTGLTMRQSLVRHGMASCGSRFRLLDCEPVADLRRRLLRRGSPRVVVIDSFQYTGLTYRDYIALKEAHRDKLLIFISHAGGRNPRGAAAQSVMYDAALKIWVEGYRAFSKGRFIGPKGHMNVWSEGAARYWGEAPATAH